MGWFDGASEAPSHHSSSHHSSSHHSHSHSQSRSGRKKHQSSSTNRSIFDFNLGGGGGGGGGGGASHHNSSRSSFFGGPSYYRRSPRKSYLQKLYAQLRRLLRDLLYYLKRNPVKVFFLVVMPLITGGALTALLARFGVRLPRGVEKMIAQMGGRSGGGAAGGFGGGLAGFGEGFGGDGRRGGGHLQFERKSYEGPMGSVGKAAGGILNAARLFM